MRTRHVIGLLCLTLSRVGLAAEPTAEHPGASASARYTIEQLMDSDTISRPSFSPDARKLAIGSARTGIANVYEITLESGAVRQLTDSVKETIGLIGYFPRDERLLFTSDRGGNEIAHLFVREIDGSTRDLTPGERVKARFAGWASDRRSFFVETNARDPRHFDLYEYQADGYAARLLFRNELAYRVEAISPDRRYVALSRIVDNRNTYAYLYDTSNRKLELLTPADQGIVEKPGAFSPDAKALFYTTDQQAEFQYLVRLELATRERRTIFKPAWDVTSASYSREGTYLVVTVNEDTRTTIQLFDARTLAPVRLLTAAGDSLEDIDIADQAGLAALLEVAGDSPGELSLLDLRSGSKKLLMNARAPGVARRDLVAGTVARFASYDAVTIPGLLYVPHAARRSADLPAVIYVHGGPGGESRVGYRPLVQYLVNHGYVVYEINNRGSSGSGKTFYHLDDRRHGDADLDDVVAAKRMLVETGYVDPARVAVMGQSYGGFMALAALAFRPDVFAAGVDLYGVSNWPRILSNTPPWWEDLRRYLRAEMGDVSEDAERLRAISPVLHADRIKRPLMVLQGANDPRVLQVESDDIVSKARANRVPVEYIVFPDEGHGFRKKANQLVAYAAIKAFLDRHVRGAVAR